MQNPFLIQKTNKNLVALKGPNKGYLQIAPSELTINFASLNPQIFLMAQKWAQTLEKLGAKKVYWITLSEAVPHLHIHLFPRWSDQEAKGLDLFALRDQCLWSWDEEANNALNIWSQENEVFILSH